MISWQAIPIQTLPASIIFLPKSTQEYNMQILQQLSLLGRNSKILLSSEGFQEGDSESDMETFVDVTTINIVKKL